MAAPTAIDVLAFQVGFGDAFLLRFHYGKRKRRHVLVDFGSFPKAKWLKDGGMRAVAEEIRSQCGRRLHAVVATHRHADHISGFATTGDDPGSVIASCKPDVVVQPWTEDPDARRDARKPTAAFMAAFAGDAADRIRAFARGQDFVASLDALDALMPVIEEEVRRLRGLGSSPVADQLSFFGENGLSNRSAVDNLMAMGRQGDARYVFFGADSGLEAVLPGVKVSVLGPPTLEQTRTIQRYASSNPDQYWLTLTRTALGLRDGTTAAFPTESAVSHDEAPSYARWLVSRLRLLKANQLLEIVRTLDAVLNNTSVILLFEVGGRKLLFPGDAQLENWAYALEQPGVAARLSEVDFYKVGHHGSLNATPREALWQKFRTRGQGLRSIVSTLPGVHGGKGGKPTEVPRRPLIAALKADAQLLSTEDLPQQAGAFAKVTIDV